MTLPHLNRRLHLYFGLALLPWFVMYGVSSYFFAHPETLRARYSAMPPFTHRGTIPLPSAISIPQPGAPPAEMRAFARQALAAANMTSVVERASFGAYRQSPTQINVYTYTFLHSITLKTDTAARTITIEDKNFRWDHFFTGMHARGGFEQDGALQKLWAIIVDLVSAGFLLWIATGLYMWWTLGARKARNWGWLALSAGIVSFALFMARL